LTFTQANFDNFIDNDCMKSAKIDGKGEILKYLFTLHFMTFFILIFFKNR